jgi:5-hydroxyisourate hydrolase-like protein (transthyretin family)
MRSNLLLWLCFLVFANIALPPVCEADTITCRVIGLSGKPVVGVTVYVYDFSDLNSVTTLTTDGAGNFSVDVPAMNPPYASMKECTVYAAGLAPGGCELKPSGRDTIQLTLPTQITGTVVDESGKPVAGATVSVNSVTSPSPFGPGAAGQFTFFGVKSLKARYTSTTNSNGIYIISGVPTNVNLKLSLDDPAYVKDQVDTVNTDQPAPPLVADPATSITGQVVRQDGKPVGPVEVEAVIEGPTPYDFETPSTTSDDNGNYKITSLAPGTYLVGIDEPNAAEYSLDWAPTSAIKVTTSLDKPGVSPNILLSAGGVVTGVVVDSKTNKPIPGVNICIYDGGQSEDQQFHRVNVITDQNGQYLAAMWGGNAQVTVQSLPVAYAVEQTKQSISVVNGQTTNVDTIAIVSGLSAIGKIIRDDGKPTGPIMLVVSCRVSAEERTTAELITANDGTFRLNGLSFGSYTLTIASPPANSMSSDWVPPYPLTFITSQAGPVTVPDIHLRPGTIVTGTVIDDGSKKPIPNVHIIIQDTDIGDMQPRTASAVTNQDGRFAVQVWAGKVLLRVTGAPQGYMSGSSTKSQMFNVIDGQPITIGPVTVTHGLTIVGHAVDEAGNAVPNLYLQTYKKANGDNDWLSIQPVTTAADGGFTVQQLLPGSFALDAGTDWTVVSPSTFNAPSRGTIKLILNKTASTTLQGTVVDTAGSPISGAVLSFERDHLLSDGSYTSDIVRASTDSDGFFAVHGVPIKSDMIQRQTVTKGGYIYQSGGDITSQGNQLKISLVVMSSLGGTVIGIVRNGLNAPVAGASVAFSTAYGAIRPGQTDTTGHFNLKNVPMGSVDIYASNGNYYTTTTAQVTATPTGLLTITLAQMPAPPPDSDIADGTQMLKKILADANIWSLRTSLTPMQDECAKILAGASLNAGLSFIKSYRPLTASDLEQIIPAQSKQNPTGAAQWGIPLIVQTQKDGRDGAVAAALGLDVAPYDLNAAISLYKIATQDITLDNLNDNNSFDGCELVALAYASKDLNADTMYQTVLTQMNKEVGEQIAKHIANFDNDCPLEEFANALALGNATLAQQLVATLPETWRVSAADVLVQELVAPNPSAALDVFHTLDAEIDTDSNDWAYDHALVQVLPLLFASDPMGSVALAKGISDPSSRCEALTTIADLMPLTSARPLYQEAENQSIDQTGHDATPASIAAHALLRDKILGDELFRQAFAKVMTAHSSDQPWQGPSYYEFAFYYSRFDPGYSRLLLESLYHKNLSADPNQVIRGIGLIADAEGMSAIDPTRAFEMVESIKDAYMRFEAGQAVAYYVVQTQKTRDNIQFDQWAER